MLKVGLVLLLGLMPLAASASGCPVPTARSATSQKLLAAINDQRAANGLPGLAWSDKLAGFAAGHSCFMASAGVMTHQGSGGISFAQRVKQAGLTACGPVAENIGAGFGSPEAVMAAWMKSPQHRANILTGQFTSMGAAQVHSAHGDFWTLVLGMHC